MDIAFVLYDKVTALDIIGPYQALAGHPSVRTHFVADRVGTVRCDTGLPLHADTTFADLPNPDVIVVPGSGYWHSIDDDALVAWLRTAHPTATWTTSVCTGALLLAKAGILTGRPATTHWVTRAPLAELGALVSTDRVVMAGNVMTAAGVSAGIDMGLTLAGELWGVATAQTIQLVLEYHPRPPFDAGSPDTAPTEITAAVRAMLHR